MPHSSNDFEMGNEKLDYPNGVRNQPMAIRNKIDRICIYLVHRFSRRDGQMMRLMMCSGGHEAEEAESLNFPNDIRS